MSSEDYSVRLTPIVFESKNKQTIWPEADTNLCQPKSDEVENVESRSNSPEPHEMLTMPLPSEADYPTKPLNATVQKTSQPQANLLPLHPAKKMPEEAAAAFMSPQPQKAPHPVIRSIDEQQPPKDTKRSGTKATKPKPRSGTVSPDGMLSSSPPMQYSLASQPGFMLMHPSASGGDAHDSLFYTNHNPSFSYPKFDSHPTFHPPAHGPPSTTAQSAYSYSSDLDHLSSELRKMLNIPVST